MGASYEDGRIQQVAVGCVMALSNGDCLTYPRIEWAIREAIRLLRFQRPGGLNSFEPSEASIHAIGELNEMTSRVLAVTFGLNLDEIMHGLEQIDVGRTSLWQLCPVLFRAPPTCTQLSRYRTHTGQCNNLFGPHLGSSNMPFRRELPPEYSYALGEPRRSVSSGGPLPPARLVALALHPDIENPSSDHSVMFMSWGQLINHDLAMASGARGK